MQSVIRFNYYITLDIFASRGIEVRTKNRDWPRYYDKINADVRVVRIHGLNDLFSFFFFLSFLEKVRVAKQVGKRKRGRERERDETEEKEESKMS